MNSYYITRSTPTPLSDIITPTQRSDASPEQVLMILYVFGCLILVYLASFRPLSSPFSISTAGQPSESILAQNGWGACLFSPWTCPLMNFYTLLNSSSVLCLLTLLKGLALPEAHLSEWGREQPDTYLKCWSHDLFCFWCLRKYRAYLSAWGTFSIYLNGRSGHLHLNFWSNLIFSETADLVPSSW